MTGTTTRAFGAGFVLGGLFIPLSVYPAALREAATAALEALMAEPKPAAAAPEAVRSRRAFLFGRASAA